MNKRARAVAVALMGLVVVGIVATGCEDTGSGVPMGGRDYDGKPPYSHGCDPNGVKMFQPDSCK